MNVYIKALSRELGAAGLKVDVFTRAREGHSEPILDLAENVRVVHLRAGEMVEMDKNLIYNHLPEFVCNLASFRQEQGLNYDLVHSHYWLSAWTAEVLRQRWSVPMVQMFHTLARLKNWFTTDDMPKETEFRAEVEERAMRLSERIITATLLEKAQMVQFYGASPEKISVIPLGMEPEVFFPMDKAAARAALGIADRPTLVFVGRVEPLKGIDVLIRAAARINVRRADSPVQVLIIGGMLGGSDATEQAELARLRRLSQHLNVATHVVFVGAKDQDQLRLYYNAADVCVVPSYYESFGLVPLEAMACGTPVVASRVGGLQVTIQDGETGFLVSVGEDAAFAERIGWLLNDPARARHMGQHAQVAAQRYRWSVVARQTIDLYTALIEQRLGEHRLSA